MGMNSNPHIRDSDYMNKQFEINYQNEESGEWFKAQYPTYEEAEQAIEDLRVEGYDVVSKIDENRI